MFDGMEENTEDTQRDPVLPLNDPGMKLCVNVLAAGRPNYLYVCLDSIFRNTVLAEGSQNVPDVFLYIDRLSNGESYAKEILKAASDFPLRGIYINEKHKGTVANYWHSFSKAFDDGYDFCVLIEEDWLITTKALQWLYEVPKISSHYSLYRWTDRMENEDRATYDKLCLDGDGYALFREGRYLSWCLAFPKDAYEFIYSAIKAGPWGLYNRHVPIAELRRTSYIDWDRTLISILKHYGLLSMVPSVSHLAHFGCKTSNWMGYGSGVNRHDEMFSGDPAGWLDNVIEIFKTTDDAEKTLLHFYPLTFTYS